MTRLVLTWLALAPIALLAKLVAVLTAPALAALSLAIGRDTLPWGLQNLSTLDDSLDGGQHQWPALYPSGVTGIALWWQRTCWIARNPAQGVALAVLGIPAERVDVIGYRRGSALIIADPPGLYYHLDTASRPVGWGYKAYWRLWGTRYVKVWIGWADIRHDGRHHEIELQFNPFRTW